MREDFAGLVDFLGEGQCVGEAAGFPVGTVAGYCLLVRAAKPALVELQCLLLDSLGGVGHITFVRLFHTINSAGRASADKYLAEEAATVLVV